MRLRVFCVFLCGFAVFGPPLCPLLYSPFHQYTYPPQGPKAISQDPSARYPCPVNEIS